MKSSFSVMATVLTLLLVEMYFLLVAVLPFRAIQVLGLPILALLGMATGRYMKNMEHRLTRTVAVILLALTGVGEGLCIWSTAGSSPIVQASPLSTDGRADCLHPDSAESALRRTVKGKPGDLESRYQLARLLEKEGRDQEAVVEYERLLNITDQEPDVHLAFAVLLMKLSRHSEAEVHLRRALDLYPSDSPWKEEARRALRRLRERGP